MPATTATTAATLIRSARAQAGLSQAELARRAGLPRSVLNAYERGHRDPGTQALAKVLAAAGFALATKRVHPQPDPQRAARILSQVLDLAASFPGHPRRDLAFPPFRERIA